MTPCPEILEEQRSAAASSRGAEQFTRIATPTLDPMTM